MAGDPLEEAPRRGCQECKVADHDDIEDRDLLESTPANPRQRVGNGERSPEPFVDMQVEPNLTGFYFETEGRYRLLVNQAGGHLECLLTLVSTQRVYTFDGQKPGVRDRRLPSRWGPLEADRHPKPIAFRFSGQHVGGGEYLLTVQPWMLRDSKAATNLINVGTLRVQASDGNAIGLELEQEFRAAWPEHGDAKSCSLLRTDRRPVLLDRYLDLESVPFAFRSQLWFPMTPQQQTALTEHAQEITRAKVRYRGKERDLLGLIAAYDALSSDRSDDHERENIAKAMEALVKEVFEAPVTKNVQAGGISLDELGLLQEPMIDALARTEVAPGRSALTSMQRILDDAHLEREHTPSLARHLGLGVRGWGQHLYEVEFIGLELIDLGGKTADEKEEREQKYKLYRKALELILDKSGNLAFKSFKSVMDYLPVTWLMGHVVIRYTGTSKWSDPDAEKLRKESASEAVFGVLLAGIGLSRSTVTADDPEINWKSSAWITGSRPVTPQEFQGAIHLMQFEAFGQVKFGDSEHGGGGSKTWISFLGDGTGPSLRAAFDGSYDGKEGAGLGAKALVGYMWLEDANPSNVVLPNKRKDKKQHGQFWSVAVPALKVHFPINGARLPIPTEEEANELVETGSFGIREALEIFAACELPLFDNPMAAIRIIGHADRTDTEKHNVQLSQNRAKSIFRYLRGLLGPDFTEETSFEAHAGTELQRVVVEGRGEELAKSEDPDDVSNQSFRRVDLEFVLVEELAGDKLAGVFETDDLSLDVTFRGTGTPKRKK